MRVCNELQIRAILFRMKVAGDAGAKYTKKSFMAFLEGQPSCDEKWVTGIVRASSPADITQALESLPSYVNKERLEFLRRTCGVV